MPYKMMVTQPGFIGTCGSRKIFGKHVPFRNVAFAPTITLYLMLALNSNFLILPAHLISNEIASIIYFILYLSFEKR